MLLLTIVLQLVLELDVVCKCKYEPFCVIILASFTLNKFFFKLQEQLHYNSYISLINQNYLQLFNSVLYSG